MASNIFLSPGVDAHISKQNKFTSKRGIFYEEARCKEAQYDVSKVTSGNLTWH